MSEKNLATPSFDMTSPHMILHCWFDFHCNILLLLSRPT